MVEAKGSSQYDDGNDSYSKFVDNYHLHLMSHADIADEVFLKFHTVLNATLKFVKYSNYKKKLDEVIHNDSIYTYVYRQTVDVIDVVTGIEIHYNTEKDRVNMCEAIEEMKANAMAIVKENGVLKAHIGLVKKDLLIISQDAKQANKRQYQNLRTRQGQTSSMGRDEVA